ncbi:hypothetical protein [Parasediminibacterium sp. JCM 36343]|uniref:hypothetical protein n=1 Tax=Parasediminibacterium sp. JCM 36343 TaxID=3374279 RepID=UPI003979B923
MKPLLIIASLLLALNAFAQHQNGSIPPVFTPAKFNTKPNPLYFVNGQLVSGYGLGSLDPKLIDSIDVKHKDTIIDKKPYYGEIVITTKKEYVPKWITYNEIKLKYTNLKKEATLFMVDNNIVDENYKKCAVDENYILKIEASKIENKAEGLNLNIIRLITKTEENIRKSKEIMIR